MIDENRTAAVKSALQKFGLPTAAGVVGTGVGLILTRKQTSNRHGSATKGVGNLVDDLRAKLDSVVGKTGDRGGQQSSSRDTKDFSAKERADRRKAREQRRKQRRSRARR